MKHQFSKTKPPVLAGVVVKKHDADCTFLESGVRRHCHCRKYFYVNPGQLRISANTTDWDEAERAGKRWVEEHDPNRSSFQPKLISEAFADFIQSRTALRAGDRHRAPEGLRENMG
jgi:hypothetical protein